MMRVESYHDNISLPDKIDNSLNRGYPCQVNVANGEQWKLQTSVDIGYFVWLHIGIFIVAYKIGSDEVKNNNNLKANREKFKW